MFSVALLGLIAMPKDPIADLKFRFHPLGSSTRLSKSAKSAISKAIGKSRVVILGELTHGDGTSFEIKVELVKYLHGELGFDALIWESGLYDCAEMDSAIGGTKPLSEVARMGVFGHWSRGKESFPVFEYARQTRSSARPLTMAGFDLQASGSASNSMFPDFLDWFKDASELTMEDRAAVDAAFQKARAVGSAADQQAAMVEAQLAVHQTAHRFLRAYETNPAKFNERWGNDWVLRRQVLKGAVKNSEMLRMHREVQEKKRPFAEPYNLRERVNAENLVWLANERFKGKKIIVWAHNLHIVRELPARASASEPGSGEVDSMGRLVGKALRGDAYSLGFLSYGGTWSWMGNPVIAFRPAESGSLESVLQKAKAPCGFLDLRRLPNTHPLRKPLAATIDQQNPLTVKRDWGKAFDGVIFIDEMKPRTQMP